MADNSRPYRTNLVLAHAVLAAAAVGLLVFLGLQWCGFKDLWIAWASYLFEAVLVASVADYIAIKALFTRIPGLPFTGLLQNKRNEVIEGVVSAFESKIMPPARIRADLAQADVASLLRSGTEKLRGHGDGKAVGKFLSSILQQGRAPLVVFAAGKIAAFLRRIEPAGMLARAHAVAERKGWFHEGVRTLFDTLHDYFKSEGFFSETLLPNIREGARRGEDEPSPSGFFSLLRRKLAEWTGTLDYEELARDIRDALVAILDAARENGRGDDRWRSLEEKLSNALRGLAGEPAFVSLLEEWKTRAFTTEGLTPLLDRMIGYLIEWIEKGTLTADDVNHTLGLSLLPSEMPPVDIAEWLISSLEKGIAALARDQEMERALRTACLRLSDGLVEQEYHEFLVMVREILDALSPTDLVSMVEEVAGANLQWLRISGAYVGGTVGLLLFGVVRWPVVGLPAFVACLVLVLFCPPVRRWLG
jgi:uncharacterized membrane-anchored protein YjiN (DUF445 family)